MNQNSAADLAALAARLPDVIGSALAGFGGFLRCASRADRSRP